MQLLGWNHIILPVLGYEKKIRLTIKIFQLKYLLQNVWAEVNCVSIIIYIDQKTTRPTKAGSKNGCLVHLTNVYILKMLLFILLSNSFIECYYHGWLYKVPSTPHSFSETIPSNLIVLCKKNWLSTSLNSSFHSNTLSGLTFL